MNYPESQLILEEIKKANRILLNCHRSPDSDSIGSALAMRQVLIDLGKEVDIICPSEELPDKLSYLAGFETIKGGIDFGKFDYSKYDLFLTLDSSSWDQVTDVPNFRVPDIKVLTIDHHKSNTRYGNINLLDNEITSVGELLYWVFEDWAVIISKKTSDALMAGIIGDTGAFRYPGVNEKTFIAASALVKIGADKDKAIQVLYRSDPFNLIKFYGEVLSRAKLDTKYNFVWSAIPYDVYDKLGKLEMAKESAASLFCQTVEGTDFGFIALERERGKLSISFRSRTGFDTSLIAGELNGGGHVYASGGKVEGLPFEQAVEKVLEVARKHANKNS